MKGLLVFAAAAAAVMTGGSAAAQPAHRTAAVRNLAVGSWAEWNPQRRPGGATYRVGDLTLTLRRGAGSTADAIHPQLVVTMRGAAPVTIDGEEMMSGFDVELGVGRWTAAGARFVMFQTFTGGAHCCTSTKVIYPEAGRLRVVDMGLTDGAQGGDIPRDQDGDGRVDFIDRDNAFLYAFASYASSFAPTTVSNIVDGRVVDVTDKPAFRHYQEEMAREARTACADRESHDRNGACAAYVAASARLGRFDQAMEDVAPLWDREPTLPWWTGCRAAPGENGCADADVITYPDFPTSLRAFLAEQGYIPRR